MDKRIDINLVERMAIVETSQQNMEANIEGIKTDIKELFGKIEGVNIKLAIATGVIIATQFILQFLGFKMAVAFDLL